MVSKGSLRVTVNLSRAYTDCVPATIEIKGVSRKECWYPQHRENTGSRIEVRGAGRNMSMKKSLFLVCVCKKSLFLACVC